MAVAVALGATVMLGACKKGDANTADTTAMAAAPGADSMKNAGASTGAMNAGAGSSTSMNNGGAMAGNQTMTDPQIFAAVAAANQGEIDAGKMASTKATNPAVRAFAHAMVTDHSMMLTKGTALAKKLNITPAPMANDSTVAMNQATTSMLSSAPKGMAFDSAYVNSQVAGHQHVLDMIKSAQGQAQNADLKAMLTSAQPAIQRHLDRIKDIQGKMK